MVAPFSSMQKNVLSIPGFYKLKQNSTTSSVTPTRAETVTQDVGKDMANEPSAEAGLKPPPNNCDSGALKIWINGLAEVTKQKSKQTVTLHKSSPTVTL